jgi:hypothetical protein
LCVTAVARFIDQEEGRALDQGCELGEVSLADDGVASPVSGHDALPDFERSLVD